IGTAQVLAYSVISPLAISSNAGRSLWLCHGTTPPGAMSSLRARNRRPWIDTGSLASSVDVITTSVTPLAGWVDIGWPVPLGRRWSAGHSPALAWPSAPKVIAAAAVRPTKVDRRLKKSLIMVISLLGLNAAGAAEGGWRSNRHRGQCA